MGWLQLSCHLKGGAGGGPSILCIYALAETLPVANSGLFSSSLPSYQPLSSKKQGKVSFPGLQCLVVFFFIQYHLLPGAEVSASVQAKEAAELPPKHTVRRRLCKVEK